MFSIECSCCEGTSEVSGDVFMHPTAPAVDSRGVPDHLGHSHTATDGLVAL